MTDIQPNNTIEIVNKEVMN